MRFRQYKLIIVIFMLLLVVKGCSTSPKIGNATNKRVVRTKAGQDTVIVAQVPRTMRDLPRYRLSFGDEIEVKVFHHPEFNETTIIRPDGRIALQRIGEIAALGRTPRQLDSLITRRYARFIRHPKVTVLVRSFGKRMVYLLGEVKAPGAYALEDGMSVLRSIATAGGYTQYAKLNSVILMRNEYFRNPVVMRLDLQNFPDKPDRARDRLLVANDIIYVPRTYIGELNNFIDQFINKLIGPPLELYVRSILYTRVFD